VYYPPAKFGDDMFSGFCFKVLTYTHTHMSTELLNVLLTHVFDCVGVSSNNRHLQSADLFK